MARESDLARRRWDERYRALPPPAPDEVRLPSVFAQFAEMFPTSGHGLDLACGRGLAGLWLARRGVDVVGYDVSAVAVDQASALASGLGVAEHCRFAVVDLDTGLPPGPSLNVVVCHKFRDACLDDALLDRLAPGGLLAISALSEVGATPGRFRAKPGELRRAFNALELIGAGEDSGVAWLVGRAPGNAAPAGGD